MLTVMVATNAFAQLEENPEEGALSTHRHEEEVYHESTLRRFEIVSIIALPFTAIHSYVGVRVSKWFGKTSSRRNSLQQISELSGHLRCRLLSLSVSGIGCIPMIKILQKN